MDDIQQTAARLAQSPPKAIGTWIHRRNPGSTATWRVEQYWSLNTYSMPGYLILPDPDLRLPIVPGSCCLMPPGCCRSFSFSEPGVHRVVHFSAPSGRADRVACEPVPDSISRINQLIDELAGTEIEAHAQARCWTILCTLAAPVSNTSGASPVQAALAYINHHLTNADLSVYEVVANCRRSHNQLTRDIRAATGRTIIGYITARRVELARTLLRTTDLPIGVIASEVGIPDAQQFNKTIRRHLGCSPSAVRATAT